MVIQFLTFMVKFYYIYGEWDYYIQGFRLRPEDGRFVGSFPIPFHSNSLPALIVVEKIAPLAHTFPMVLLTTPSSPPVKRVLLNLTCETKNLIYMIQCNRCNLQYIGETKRRLKDRTIDNPNTKSKPTTAADHFLTAPNHTANDMQLIPIEKVFSNRDSVRKAREAFLISKGRTLLPHGLNIREEPY